MAEEISAAVDDTIAKSTLDLSGFRHPKKRAFLAAFAVAGTIAGACRAAKITRPTAKAWKQKDPAFAAAWEEAIDAAGDNMEQHAIERATAGWLEPVFGTVYNEAGRPVGKQIVGHVRRKSDTLLIFLLKGAKPEKYADRKFLSGADGGPLKVEVSQAAEKYNRLRFWPDGRERMSEAEIKKTFPALLAAVSGSEN